MRKVEGIWLWRHEWGNPEYGGRVTVAVNHQRPKFVSECGLRYLDYQYGWSENQTMKILGFIPKNGEMWFLPLGKPRIVKFGKTAVRSL